jgi:hypothetical protein
MQVVLFNLKNNYVSNILASIAIVISVIVLIRDCAQDRRVAELGYVTNAVQFRPNLKIISKPIVSIQFRSEIPVNELLSRQSTDTINSPTTINVTAEIKLINTGNAKANIFSYMWKDTVTGDEKIRQILLNKKKRTDLIQLVSNEDFYKIIDLSAGETKTIEVKQDIENIPNDTFVLHFLFLYKSETDALFDTYYWARYSLGNIIVKPEIVTIDGKSVLRPNFGNKQIQDIIVLVDDNSSTKMYSQKQSKDIIRFLSQAKNRNN